MLNTLASSHGSAQVRFVARPGGVTTGTGHAAANHVVTGVTFPVMRGQDLNDLTEPNAWLDIARQRLRELDARLVRDGWRRSGSAGAHWWSLTYECAHSDTDRSRG